MNECLVYTQKRIHINFAFVRWNELNNKCLFHVLLPNVHFKAIFSGIAKNLKRMQEQSLWLILLFSKFYCEYYTISIWKLLDIRIFECRRISHNPIHNKAKCFRIFVQRKRNTYSFMNSMANIEMMKLLNNEMKANRILVKCYRYSNAVWISFSLYHYSLHFQ